MIRFDKFTLKGQEALQAAQAHAQELNNPQVAPEHLLWALIQQKDGVVLPVLQKLGANVQNLARDLGMSPSGFHEHFKAVTAMSPLQFQKQLRLQEARRLLLGEDMDAATVAYRVGYEDASHFSREYKRLFGFPPVRDVERLRASAKAGV